MPLRRSAARRATRAEMAEALAWVAVLLAAGLAIVGHIIARLAP